MAAYEAAAAVDPKGSCNNVGFNAGLERQIDFALQPPYDDDAVGCCICADADELGLAGFLCYVVRSVSRNGLENRRESCVVVIRAAGRGLFVVAS